MFLLVTMEESVDNVTVCDTELDYQLWSVMRYEHSHYLVNDFKNFYVFLVPMVAVSLTLKETLKLEFVMTFIFLGLLMCTFQIDVLEALRLF